MGNNFHQIGNFIVDLTPCFTLTTPRSVYTEKDIRRGGRVVKGSRL